MIDVNVGDRVTVETQTYDRAGSGFDRITINTHKNETADLRVTRVYSHTVIVRGRILGGGGEASILVWKQHILTANGVDASTGTAFVPPRKLGVKPGDTPEMTYIGLDHPGIQWLFEDMAKFADRKSWCNQYDELAEELGIPGRPQEFEVEVEIEGGISVVAEIEAHSEAEAEAELRRRLAAFTG